MLRSRNAGEVCGWMTLVCGLLSSRRLHVVKYVGISYVEVCEREGM